MIGYDDIQGAERFIFTDALTGGINIIAALIGLFAIPQVLEMLAKRRAVASIDVVGKIATVLEVSPSDLLAKPVE